MKYTEIFMIFPENCEIEIYETGFVTLIFEKHHIYLKKNLKLKFTFKNYKLVCFNKVSFEIIINKNLFD